MKKNSKKQSTLINLASKAWSNPKIKKAVTAFAITAATNIFRKKRKK